MIERQSTPQGHSGEVTEVGSYRYRVKSFTDDTKSYLVDLAAGYCGCPHYRHTGNCGADKHYVLAEAVAKCRQRPFGSEAAEEHVTRLVHRMYEPMTAVQSYRLYSEVMSSPHATKRMRTVVGQRHARLVQRAA